jgi:hypothetical protein
MADPETIELLNRLLNLHLRSLPMYLASARPWYPQADCEAKTVLRHIAEDQQLMVDRIGAVILDLGGSVQPSEFPMEFTDLHDLSIDYLYPQVIARQKSEIEWMRQCCEQLKDSPVARAVAQESLGAAQAHLDNLNDLQPSAST